MADALCTNCGAAIAEGTRFCVKCGQPVGQAAPPPIGQAPVLAPPPPPMMEPAAPTKQGPGAGVWIGIFGILLLLGGAALWFYSARGRLSHAGSTVEVAAAPTPTPPEPPPPPPASSSSAAPTAAPEAIPPNPDLPQAAPTPAPPPAPSQPVRQPKAAPVEPTPSAPPATPAPAQPTTGVLHAAVEVAQNGEVVFDNLPAGRLHFIFDHSLWQPTISRQPNGTQTLVMRSLKPGMQTVCDVKWEIVQ